LILVASFLFLNVAFFLENKYIINDDMAMQYIQKNTDIFISNADIFEKYLGKIVFCRF